MHSILSVALLFTPSLVRSAPQAGVPEAPVPSICNPIMPLAEYEAFSAVKDLCMCIANKDYDACTDAAFTANRADESILCGVRQCQDYNWCEIQNPCAQTTVPGIKILGCSTTVEQYPNFSSVSREWDRRGLPQSSVGTCLLSSSVSMPASVKVYLDLVKSAFSTAGAVGSTP